MDGFTYIITVAAGALMAIFSIAVVAGFFYIAFRFRRQHEEKIVNLKASGRQGEATIIRLPSKGRLSGAGSDAMYRHVSIGLEIRVPGIEIYEIDKGFLIPPSSLRDLEIGKIVPVWIDPDNPRNTDKIVIHIE